jgi:hypothetical protein
MHFEVLIEDQSGKAAMEILLPKLIGDNDSFRIIPYKGIGRIPKNLTSNSDAKKRSLLNRLPGILRGYGRTPDCGIIVVICDLDDKDKHQFLSELHNVLNACNPRPEAIFCLAIEEFEAWYLGDLNAVRKAYPNAKNSFLTGYINDSICGTWELLADAVYKGGYEALKQKGGQEIGKQKSIWAKTISPHMDVDNNASPSFLFLRSQLR